MGFPTRLEAIATAQHYARKREQWRFVVHEADFEGAYQVTDCNGLKGYYGNSPIVVAIQPDGEIEQ